MGRQRRQVHWHKIPWKELLGADFVDALIIEAEEHIEANRRVQVGVVHKIETSSNIYSLEYKEEKKQLHVVFKSGARGYYSNITPTLFTQLMNSESKGSFLVNRLRPTPKLFPWTATGTKEAEQPQSISSVSEKVTDKTTDSARTPIFDRNKITSMNIVEFSRSFRKNR